VQPRRFLTARDNRGSRWNHRAYQYRRTGNGMPAAGGFDNRSMAGYFDNRSVSFVTDFPSATRLLSFGIKRALLVQRFKGQPQADLAHTLRAWQEAGIAIELKEMAQPGPPVPCVIARPSWFGAFWYRAMSALGLQRSELGGFGGVLPDPSAG
jgi:hypothetical protein